VERRAACVGLVLPPGEHCDPVPLICTVPRGTEPLSRRGLRCYVSGLADGDVMGFARRAPAPLPCARPSTCCVGCRHTSVWRRAPGIAKARFLAALIEPLTESAGETWLRLRLIDAGFPRPRAQIEILDGAGRVLYRLDLGWDELRLAIEYDGLAHHGSSAQQGHDTARREALLTARFLDPARFLDRRGGVRGSGSG
jgi:hypothetical protein